MARRNTFRHWLVCLGMSLLGVLTWSTYAAPRQFVSVKKRAAKNQPAITRDAAIRTVRDDTITVQKQEQAIREKFGRRITVNLNSLTFKAALEQVAGKGGFDLIFDPVAVTAGDIEPDLELSSTKFEQKSIRHIMEHVLREHADTALTFVLENGVLNIITQEKADSIKTERMVSIAALLNPRSPVATPLTQYRTTIADDASQLKFGAVGSPLIDIIRATTSGIWEDDDPEAGGSIRKVDQFLVIRQTQQVHEEIKELVRALEIAARNELHGGVFALRYQKYDHTADAAARAILGKSIAVNYQDATLAEVIADLSKRTGLKFLFDRVAITAGEIAPDQEINLNLKSRTLRSALKLILQQHADTMLTILLEEGVITVVTQEKADAIKTISIYDVRDFVGTNVDTDTLISSIKSQTSGIWEKDDPEAGGAINANQTLGVLVVRQTQQVHDEVARVLARFRKKIKLVRRGSGAKKTDKSDEVYVTEFYTFQFNDRAAQLQTSIQKFVAPKSWAAKDSEAAISIVEGTLIIRQTVKTHREIRRFLRKLIKAEELGRQSRNGFGFGLPGAIGGGSSNQAPGSPPF